MKISGQFSPAVQNHLQIVYLLLTVALMACAAGAYMHILWTIGGLVTLFGSLGSIILILLLPPSEETKRFILLIVISLLEGASIAPVFTDPSILVTGFMGMALCFSATAAVGNSPMLLIFGVLSYGFTLTFWLCCFLSLFSPSVVFNLQLVCGLPYFLGYFTLDTLQIIESTQTEDHDHDHLRHALTLSTDFFALLWAYPFIMAKSGRSIRRWLYGKEEGSSDGNGTGEGGSQHQEVPILVMQFANTVVSLHGSVILSTFLLKES